MPVGLSLAISTGWVTPLFTLGLFLGLELLNNNLLEPWLYGRNIGVSAVAVLLAAVFWMWLWGPVGLLIAMPTTVCMMVIGKHVPELSFLNILLGNEPVFEPKTRVYQRLLAGDIDEATELFEGYLAKQPLVEVYDTVLIPALSMAEIHRHLGKLLRTHFPNLILVVGLWDAQVDISKTESVAALPSLRRWQALQHSFSKSSLRKPQLKVDSVPSRRTSQFDNQ